MFMGKNGLHFHFWGCMPQLYYDMDCFQIIVFYHLQTFPELKDTCLKPWVVNNDFLIMTMFVFVHKNIYFWKLRINQLFYFAPISTNADDTHETWVRKISKTDLIIRLWCVFIHRCRYLFFTNIICYQQSIKKEYLSFSGCWI